MIDSHIEVRNRLSLYSLCSINDKQCTFTRSNASRHLIREVYMARSIDKIKNIFLLIQCVLHLDSMTLDSNTTFTLQIHIIEHLPTSNLYRLSIFKETIRQSRLTMINMGNNAEISYMIHPFVYIFKVQI